MNYLHPRVHHAKIKLLETFTETPPEICTLLGELNGLANEKGNKSVGQFVETTIEQISVRHSVSFLLKSKHQQ